MKLKKPKYITTDVGSDGKERHYYRRPGQKKIRVHGVPWTPSFMAAYEAASNGVVLPSVHIGNRAGTFSWLCDKYFESNDFKSMDDELSKPNRRNTLRKICAEPIQHGSKLLMGDKPIATWNKKAVIAMRDRAANRGTPGTANDWLKSIRAVFKWAAGADEIDTNPAQDVPYISTGSRGFHSWSIEEVEKFEATHAVGTLERLAMGLLLFSAQRKSDVTLLGPNNIKSGWLIFTQQKNRKRKPVDMEIPVRPELLELIEATPGIGADTFLVNSFGRPFSRRGFSDWFAKACVAADVPGRSHGLRKAAAARLAELGAPENEIMAITGHTTSKEIKRYTEAARKRVLATNATARHAKKDAA